MFLREDCRRLAGSGFGGVSRSAELAQVQAVVDAVDTLRRARSDEAGKILRVVLGAGDHEARRVHLVCQRRGG